MSIIVPTSYTDLRGVRIRPGAPIIEEDWETINQNNNHLYARGSERHPVFWDDTPIETTSTTYVQPEPIDSLTAVWRPTRIADTFNYRLAFYVYGVNADVRAEVYDATVGGGGSLGTVIISCGSTAEWGSASGKFSSVDVLTGGGDPIPLGVSFEIKASTATAEVYQIHFVSEILNNTQFP